ncbi:MAG TPA: hypothetical protein VFB80_11655 [Pirellulaceae bacterium]|nr:hypothetical protein [Pirellulaceae bacterium]
MRWIRADYQLETSQRSARGMLILVWAKHQAAHRDVMGFLERFENDPDGIEKSIVELIDRYRPELKGCEVWGMHYDPMLQRWEFFVTHQSLSADTWPAGLSGAGRTGDGLATISLVPPPREELPL